MSETFTIWLNRLLFPVVDAYGEVLTNFPLNFLSYILSAILLALFMQVIFAIFPVLKTIADTIMFPFRMLHVWLHVQEARKIIMERQSTSDSSGNPLKFLSYYSTGFGVKAEKSGIALSGICTPREASKIANAPLKGVLVLLLLLTLLTPFLRISFAGKLVHLYIFIGIATSSFPSASDYKFTYNMLLLNASINPKWTLLPVLAFSAGFIIAMVYYQNILFAILWGIAFSSLCIWNILMVETRKNIDNSDLSREGESLDPPSGIDEPERVADLHELNEPDYLVYQLESGQ
ncbi:MAG: hypothetical protein ACFFD4_26610 [Candidatus Odinarchaeota archaeon]